MTEEKPRYEFRTFGQNFGEAILRMKHLSRQVPEKFRQRHSEEIYIISPANTGFNIKIREQKLDIKKLIDQREGLEQWDPVAKAQFPLNVEFLAEQLFPALQVEIPDLSLNRYDLKQWLRLVQVHPDLMKVRVKKQRFGFMVNNTICEYANVLVNGAKVVTVSSESTEIGDVKKTISDLGLIGAENINYLKAIKRITGMEEGLLEDESF